MHRNATAAAVFSLLALIGCAPRKFNEKAGAAIKAVPGDFKKLNTDLNSEILYELQVRSANACDPTVGSPEQKAACDAKAANKSAPKVKYMAEGMSCKDLDRLHRIRLGNPRRSDGRHHRPRERHHGQVRA